MTDISRTETDSDAVWNVYAGVSPGDTLQQGDLIKFSNGEGGSHYGIVVTADCDLDKRKHSRLVTLVPLLSVEKIVCSCLAFDAFDNYVDQLRQFCKKSLGIEESILDPQFLVSVKSRLLLKNISDRSAELAARAIAHEQDVVTISDLKSVLEAIGVSWEKAITRFRSQLLARGDLLVLSNPPLTKENARVAWLRAMWQEQVSAIAIRTSESAARKGVRVAQLNSPYRYRLTQMLGQVFADIGLPEIPADPIDTDFRGLNI